MDNQKIGDYINSLRKDRHLTQKELADRLGVTDKAVSKWERGAGYPDISMLRPLADVLGITVNELLEGESGEQGDETNKEDISNALDYADKIMSLKEYNKGKLIAAIFAITLFIAIFTCVIVNVAVNHQLSWSYYVMGSCIFGGSLILPPLLKKKQGFYISLCLLTILIMPFLAIIQATLLSISPGFTMKAGSMGMKTVTFWDTSNWLWTIGLPVSLIWLVLIWLMVFIIRWKKINLWFLVSIGALLSLPGQLITNYVIDQYLNTVDPSYRQVSTISSIVAILAIAGIFAVIGLMKRNR